MRLRNADWMWRIALDSGLDFGDAADSGLDFGDSPDSSNNLNGI